MDNNNPSTQSLPSNKEMEEQLKQYREEQRRRHEQVATDQFQHPHDQSIRPSFTPVFTTPIASAPPEDHILQPEDASTNRPLYPKLNDHKKREQEEEDARLAMELQKQEEEQTRTSPPIIDQPISSAHHVAQESSNALESSTMQDDEDEQLARALQESEQDQPQERSGPPQQPGGEGGLLSTLGTIGRGLYNAYTTYSQAHQQAHRDAEQQAQQQTEVQSAQRQIDRDEALARRMQAEDDQGASPEQLPPPFRFTYRHAPPTSHHPSLFGYDSEDETRSLNFPHAQQWDQLSALNTLLRSTGAPPEEPLFQHLQELMQRTRHRNTATLPRQRYVFPGNVFNVQGVENLPPGLLNMMNGETDTSYESLLELAERMQPVSRGADSQQIDQLPTRTYSEGSMPRDQSKCGICLSDYEPGEELTSLPCLHSFHKECITHWLGINKVCPVCRVEIPQSGQVN